MKAPWASIAKIEVDGMHSGTGFLVTPNHVLTALHVVADKSGRPYPRIVLRFNRNAEYMDGSKEWETGAEIAEGLWSVAHDFAMLRCDDAPPSVPLRLSDRRLHRDECSAPGFAVQNPTGFTVTGDISSVNDPLPDWSGTAIGIQFRFGTGVKMKGHSGAAVFVNNRVAGILRTAFLDELEMTMGGIVHATPIQEVVDSCNRLSPGLLSLRPPVRWPRGGVAESPVLADRREEFEIFERMVSGASDKRVLLLEGESGSGKTVLANELAEYARRRGLRVAKADCKGTPPLDSVIDCCVLDAPDLLEGTAAAQGGRRYTEVIEDLAALDRPFLLALDTWQDASEAVRKWVTQTLLGDLRRMPGVLILISGQKDLPDRTRKPWEELAESRRLQAIHSADDWFEYSRRKWPSAPISRDHVEAITHVASGRPNVVDGYLETFRRNLPSAARSGGGV